MQDEPEPGAGFSYKMSLKERIGMLGIDHQHGLYGSHEPGVNPGFSPAATRSRFPGNRGRRCTTGWRRRWCGTNTAAWSVLDGCDAAVALHHENSRALRQAARCQDQ